MRTILRYLLPASLLALLTATALPAQPVVNLGPDFVACDAATLDAGNPGATYLWSTGATTQTIAITTSGIYWVDVTQGGTTRDSISATILATPSPPVASDTSVCGTGTLDIFADGGGSTVVWWDQASSGDILGFGSPIRLPFTTADTLYPQGIAIAPYSLGAKTNIGVGTGGTYSTGNGRGFTFDAFQDILIKSIHVYPQVISTASPMTFNIELRTSTGTVLKSRSFSLTNPASVKTELDLWFNVPTGNTYRLVINNLVNGRFFLNFNDNKLPYVLPGVARIVNSTPTLGEYYFLYDWQIGTVANTCTSARTPVAINILPTPVADLGADTVLCGGETLILDVAQPGATYLWSTGATSPGIVVSATDTYAVEVFLGICETTDTIVVYRFDDPPLPTVSDTIVCGTNDVLLHTTTTADQLLWYNAPAGGSIVAFGDSVVVPVSTTTTLYAEAINSLSILLGQPDNVGVGTGGTYSNGDGRGFRFDAFQNLIIRSVRVYPQLLGGGPVRFDIELRTSTDSVLARRSFRFTNPNSSEVLPLWFSVTAGNNYRLVVNNLTGGRLFINFNDSQLPYTLPGIARIITSTPTAGEYYYLYDWQLVLDKNACRSARAPLTIQVLPVPTVELGNDTVLCGGATLSLDASYPGSTYQWSTGATTSGIVVDSSGSYRVEVTLANCSVADSLEVFAFETPVAPTIADTFLCGPGEIDLSIAAGGLSSLWYSDPAGTAVAYEGTNPRFTVVDTTTFYIEHLNSRPLRVGPAANNIGTGSTFSDGTNRGVIFSISRPCILESVHVYPKSTVLGEPIFARIQVRTASGTVVQERDVQIGPGPVQKTEVPLWFPLQPGTGYRLVVQSISGGTLAINFNTTLFPFQLPGVASITGSLQGTDYYYFYDWKIITPENSCAGPRVPVTIDVKLPLLLPDYVYSCDDTLVSGGVFPGSFVWNTGATTPDLLVNTSGIYTLQVTDNAGCTVRDTVEVDIPVNAGLPNDGILCGDVLTTNYGADAVYFWSTGDTTPTLTISNPGTYFVLVFEPRGCVLTDTITVTGFDAFPTVELGSDLNACQSVVLDAGNPGFAYQWSNGATTQQITVSASGTYSVVVTNANDCASADTIGVSITPAPTADFFVPDTIYEENLIVSFVNLSSLGAYLWDFGDGAVGSSVSPLHVYPDTGYYCVKLIVTDIVSNCGQDTVERCFWIYRPATTDAILSLAGRRVRVYPNPVADVVQVELGTGRPGRYELALFTAAGQRVGHLYHTTGSSSETIQMNMATLPPGVYLLRLTDAAGQRLTTMLLKQHP
ncbi:MAG: hypothetical protein OHK0039_20970 [Bacteroidia bacterium]